jgi:hypothetical protein
MEVFIMSEVALERRGRVFGAAAVGTLVIGIAAALLVIYHLQPPPPMVVRTPPETKVVEKVVYVPKAAPVAPVLPSPPIVELPRLVPVAPPSFDPPTAPKVTATGVWDGVWRRKEAPLPMFRLHQEEDGVGGTCATNWGAIVPLHGVGVTGDALEFVVDDVVSRVHIRMALDGQDKAKVEQWVMDDDWMTSLERANKTAKTPQQALLLKAALQQNARKFRKPVMIGVFTRQSGE